MPLLRYALRSLWARRLTTLATALGIALLVFVLAASGMLASGIRHTMSSAGSPARALVRQQDQWSERGSQLPIAALGLAAAAPHVARNARGEPLVTGEIVSQLMLPRSTDASHYSTVQVRGVASNVFELRPHVQVVAGRALQPGTAEAMVGRGIAGRFAGLALGGSFELAAGRPIRIVGVFESGGSAHESEVWMDLESTRSALDMAGSVSSITVALESPAHFDAFAAPLLQDRQSGLAVEPESNYYERISRHMTAFVSLLGIAEATIVSLGAILGTTIVAYTSIVQRRAELGVLRALGFLRRSILSAVLIESLALALVGGALGAALALLTPWLDFHTVNSATNQEVAFHFRPTASVLLMSLAAAVLVGLLGGAWPALRAARMDPIQAMRE